MALVRRILVAALAVLAGVALLAWALLWWKPVGVDAYVNKISLELLLTSPQSMSQIGLVEDTWLDTYSGRLDSYTPDADKKALALLKRARKGLDKYGPNGLTGQQALTWRVAARYLDEQIAYLDSPIPMDPYRINQISGVAIDTPMFLTDIHLIRSRRSAERYIRRLDDFGRVLAELKARAEADRAAGIVAPDFVLDKSSEVLRTFIAGGPAKNILLTSFETRLAAVKGLSAESRAKLLAAAAESIRTHVIPGYEALIALLQDERASAVHDAGVWRLPGGSDFYATRLRAETTTGLTAQQIHEIGLAQVARIEQEMTAILDSQGVPPGPVGERIDRLMVDPAYVFPDTPEGKKQILDYLNGLRAGIEAKAAEYFSTPPKDPLEILAMPAYSEGTAAGAYYVPAALNGGRPGRLYINLKTTAAYPRWTLPTLFYHEAEPGHHFQISAAMTLHGLPVLRQVLTPTAYAEGWALYAERLVKEIGFYDKDPLGDLGRLQSEMFRATRLVVDTGMHDRKWSRERAIAYMREKTGMTEDDVTREVERYAAWPGQACAYTIGLLAILKLREQAKAELGGRFDIRAFHDEILGNGGLPLDVLQMSVDDWIARAKAAPAN